MDPRDAPQVVVHFYRASVQHADVWRQRLDATTNWAVVTTAAVLTFAFGSGRTGHYLVLVALVFDSFFLFMETRRYQTYNLWQRRIRLLHRFLVAPALAGAPEQSPESRERQLAELADDLGRSVPAISLLAALGYRVRRNYGPLVTLVILTWGLKLYIHPGPPVSWTDYVGRAAIGLVPGSAVLLAVTGFFAVFVLLAIRAPSEQMEAWVELPAPIDRLMPPGIRLPGAERRAGIEVGLGPGGTPPGGGEEPEEERSRDQEQADGSAEPGGRF
ncbi:MAG TPA: DUF2270 domain-containing protein [Longimicrobiales bacterium]|nr:DUF2270 domain-containing protein [Longimicrobiales bacterium]